MTCRKGASSGETLPSVAAERPALPISSQAFLGYAAVPTVHARTSRWLLWTVGAIAALLLLWFCLPLILPYDYLGPPQPVMRARAMIDLTKVALDLYRLHIGRYPLDSDGGLEALLTRPTTGEASELWAGPYLRDRERMVDPWAHKLLYRCPGRHNPDSYDLQSVGPDGVSDTDDDITNWTQ